LFNVAATMFCLTNGASNNKWSYFDLARLVNHEAHVEAVEDGTHSITIANQPGCTVGAAYRPGATSSRPFRQPRYGVSLTTSIRT
jgi:hypothetical protein